MTQPSWPGRDDIARRARRRWRWTMGFIGVVVAITIPVGQRFGLIGHRHHRAPHRHHNTAVVTIVLIVTIVVAAGAGFFVLRAMMRNPEGRFAPPIAAGLPRHQRRQAARNIRRGTPSGEPTMAAVERESAQRTISQARFSGIIFVVAIGGEAAEAVTQTSTVARVFFGAAAVMFVSFFVLNLWTVKRATAYMARVNGLEV